MAKWSSRACAFTDTVWLVYEEFLVFFNSPLQPALHSVTRMLAVCVCLLAQDYQQDDDAMLMAAIQASLTSQ